MTTQPPHALRVREKLIDSGANQLSDTELLAVFISSGNAKKSCVQLAHDLLKHFGDLRSIFNTDLATFQQIPGFGIVRYTQLQAARELCRRHDFICLQKETQLTSSQQTCTFLKRKLRDKKNETFAALFLDSQYRVLTYEELFTGTINTASVHPRPIIERALKLNAAAIIIAHNHPSGISDASQQDIKVTQRLQKALELIDVHLLDHLVVGDNEVYSIMNEVKWACH
ncbi:MAG: DNA repair protein RadC [Legionellaceae bacterium]|nr:DNA repair protein RadC [Legionellaceae bacterium]